MKATLRFDGGHRKGIDMAAYGFTIEDAEGNLLARDAQNIAYTTHKVAEYRGLIAGLLRTIELGITDLQVHGDSQIVIFQMSGTFKAKAEHLAALRDEARGVAATVGKVEYNWNRRDENVEADLLVNLALDGEQVPPAVPVMRAELATDVPDAGA